MRFISHLLAPGAGVNVRGSLLRSEDIYCRYYQCPSLIHGGGGGYHCGRDILIEPAYRLTHGKGSWR
jgi:hypothetical protein